MGYFEKQNFTRDQAQKHGVDLKYETVNGTKEQVDWDATNAAVTKAIANDYDTRRSLEAASSAGNKKAQKVGSISNISEAVAAERFMAKTHSNRMGATGKYSSANDEGNVTKFWNDKNAKKQQASMDAKYATANQLNALQDKIKQRAEGTTPAEPVELSKTLSNAQQNVEDFDDGVLGQQGSLIFGKIGKGNDLEQATDETMSSAASGDGEDYKNDYSANVKGGLQLSGVETRGPRSGLKRDGSGFG